MTGEPSNEAEQIRCLLNRSFQDAARLGNRLYYSLCDLSSEMRRGASGERIPPEEFIARWRRLNLTYYSLLANHGLAFVNEFVTALERALGVTRPDEQPQPDGSHGPGAEVLLRARQGEVALAAFALTNSSDSPAEIRFECENLVSTAGHVVSADRISFLPRCPWVPPHSEVQVKVAVDVTPEFFSSERYESVVRVVGPEARRIVLALNVLPGVGKTARTTAAEEEDTNSGPNPAKCGASPA